MDPFPMASKVEVIWTADLPDSQALYPKGKVFQISGCRICESQVTRPTRDMSTWKPKMHRPQGVW